LLTSISTKDELNAAWIVIVGSETKPEIAGDYSDTECKLGYKMDCNPTSEFVGLAFSNPLSKTADFDVNDFYDQIIAAKFARYDCDDSGTLNSQEEVQQLTTNLVFVISSKIQENSQGSDVFKTSSSALVERANIAMAGLPELHNENALSMEDYSAWFKLNVLFPIEGDLEAQHSRTGSIDSSSPLVQPAKEDPNGSIEL